MKKQKPNNLLSQLRSRNKPNQEINPNSAKTVLRTYIQPRLNRDYIITSRPSLARTQCSTPVGASLFSPVTSPSSMSGQLSQELFSSQSTLYSTHIKLDSTSSQTQALLKNLQDYQDFIYLANVTKATLAICMKDFRNYEKPKEEVTGYEKLVKVNKSIREQVEHEQGVNNIRFFMIFCIFS